MQKLTSFFMAIIMFFSSSFSALFGITPNGIYNVGANEKYKTINSALTQWAKDGYPKATVNIANGKYEESVTIGSGHNISLIGESREGVVIRTYTGNYVDAPICIRHGNVEVRNMTVIADHSKNPEFSYFGGTSSTRAYAFHIDGGKVPGKVLIENVTAISYQSPAFGMGLIPDATIRIENCESISYTDATENGKPVKVSLNYGSLLCHKPNPTIYPDRGGEKLELVNVQIYSENTENALFLSNSIEGETFDLLAINTTLKSGASKDGSGKFVYRRKGTGGELNLDIRSRKNSCEELNYKVF